LIFAKLVKCKQKKKRKNASKVHQKCIKNASKMCQKMCDRFLNFLEFDIRRRMNMQILLRNVKKLACGTCIRICPLPQNENILKER